MSPARPRASRAGGGQGLPELLASREAPMPVLPAAPQQDPPPERVNAHRPPRRGRAERGHGWTAAMAPPATMRATTDQIGGLYPLVASPGLPARGAPMGADAQSGGTFYVDPIGWLLPPDQGGIGLTTNPNLFLFGEPGMGKSTTIATLGLRLMPFGVKTLIAGDVKGEYSPLVRALGYEPISVGYGHQARINPLDLGPLAARWDQLDPAAAGRALDDVIARWTLLLDALCSVGRHTPTATDTAVLADVLRRLSGLDPDHHGLTDAATRPRPITIPDVHRALEDPEGVLWQTHRFADRQQFLDETRRMTDALGNLVRGPLKGLFDGPSTVEIDWAAPIQSLDLSGLASRGEAALGVAMTCLGSWSQAATDLRSDGDVRMVVRDEMWRQMRLGASMVAAVDAELRLSRAHQVISVLAAHKPGDLLTVGDTGSQAVNTAKDMLALCDTHVLLGQTTDVGAHLAEALALSEIEHACVRGWCTTGKGRALWKVKSAGFQVQGLLTGRERAAFDTNTGLTRGPTVPERQPGSDPTDKAAPSASTPTEASGHRGGDRAEHGEHSEHSAGIGADPADGPGPPAPETLGPAPASGPRHPPRPEGNPAPAGAGR